MTRSADPVAVREHLRARALCYLAAPHTRRRPCAAHVDEARRDIAARPTP